jgi:hypothetical protein
VCVCVCMRICVCVCLRAEGGERSLGDFCGKVVLVTNVASLHDESRFRVWVFWVYVMW